MRLETSDWKLERAMGPIVAILGLVVVLALLQVAGLAFWQGLVVNLGIFLILVLSLNLSSGFTGVFSLGHIGFMALGAYGSAILTLPLREKQEYLPNLPTWLAGMHFDFRLGSFPLGFLIATVIAAILVSLVALLVGLVLMRLSGHFVAVATLGFLVIVRVILFNADSLTRGSRTFSNVTPYTNIWWVWAWALLTVYVVWRIKRSPFGRATFKVITMLVVGGMGSVSGSIVGTVLVVGLAEVLRRLEDPSQLYGMSGIVLAVLFILIIIFRREGLLGQRELALDRLFMKGGGARSERQITNNE